MDKDRYFILCDCGCGEGFVFDFLEDTIYVNPITSKFYSKQSTLKDTIRDYYSEVKFALNNKRSILMDVQMTKEDAVNLLNFLEKYYDRLLDFEEWDKSYATVHPYKQKIKGCNPLYFISLVSRKKNVLSVFQMKEYKKYEVILTKKDVERIIKKLEQIV